MEKERKKEIDEELINTEKRILKLQMATRYIFSETWLCEERRRT